MPEYVYALHDFTPQVADEIEFKVGDRIEVIEKDDLYGDGWWQGRNPAGHSGLFPQSYTSPTPPSSSTITFPDQSPAESLPTVEPTSSALHTLPEESEPVTGNADSRHSPTESERRRKPSEGEVMMRATMTDVQRAIEQLGRNDRDGTRSFSFASSHGDYSERSETETEDDHDADADADDELGWHKDARAKLAQRAKRENEQRQAREAEEQPRAMIPPIDVEVSDESDADDEDSPTSPRRRQQQYPRITEVDEDVEESPAKESQESQNSGDSIIPSDKYLVPDETDLPTATALTFPEPSPVHTMTMSTPTNPPVQITEPTSAETLATPQPAPASVLHAAAPEPAPVSEPAPSPAPAPASVPIPASPIVLETPVQPLAPVISPTPSTIKVAQQLPFASPSSLPSPTASSTGSHAASSAAGIQHSLTPATTAATLSTPHQSGTNTPDLAKKPTTHPSEWNVEEVIEWLKSKGFDQGVCDKFIEQEITGDVLLELNADILKSEIGIAAFGKRVRIVNAITELRRPPSIEEAEAEPQPGPMLTPRSLTHSFQYPGSPHSHPSHSHTHSMASSAQHSYNNSPFGPPSPSVVNGLGSAGLGSLTSPESPPHTGDLPSPMSRNGWRASDPGSIHGSVVNLDDENRGRTLAGLGLGLPGPKSTKSRPSQLVLSPSDSALGETVAAVQDREGTSESIKDERAVVSESESVRGKDPKSRRRLFGRSADSGSLMDTASNHSAGTPLNSPPASASPVDETVPVRRRSKGTRSIDERKPDRLSLFGSSFTGTLGKHRKPAPRLSNSSSVGEKSESSEKHHIGTFSRLRDKRSSSRPGTSDGTSRHPEKEKEKEKEKEIVKEKEKEKSKPKDEFKEKEKKDRAVPAKERDPALLRKRTSSTTDHPTRATLAAAATVGPNLKAGQSILEQIGTPDHNGWMRKKGDRYNAWKLRYFVLKGPHLYWLRSNNKSETKIKGYLNIVGYKVMADENVDPGRYGFRIVHDNDKPHYFSSDEQLVVREWMKALMKATITRDFTNPVMSSCNIPTIPLTVAQAMNPAPRPPSPTARDATQKALRRENPHQLSSRDAQVLLMGMPNKNQNGERARLESFFTNDTVSTNEPESPVTKKAVTPKSPAPPRPSRELRRLSTAASQQPTGESDVDAGLIEWANSHLPRNLRIKDPAGPLCGGLALLRLAEDIKGKPSSPPVPDAAFPSGPNDDKLDGLFRLFDYLLDNDVKMGSVSINDIRQGKREKIVQLLRALKAWEERRRAIAESVGRGAVAAGPFMGMAGPLNISVI
ncbi:hypothetical protein L226DRAFT_529790 [Lentinus tigrinus ALCF2SS1-7]|uniref:PH-domain-containing protein n=1 Tax=Lentinus tigrinus ALCF2SS1-6 TaxID=1328759 RepID=A0A5C2SV10_9APHY|nr:hypothetical protein L227DRAFT_569582 [Lentinus tigrinus ALCF2SS1-6]RPD81387.1 hypothetical protein L226DRAFT_529790 [Lentinus tigrinus ALCF2SS1-7]